MQKPESYKKKWMKSLFIIKIEFIIRKSGINIFNVEIRNLRIFYGIAEL